MSPNLLDTPAVAAGAGDDAAAAAVAVRTEAGSLVVAPAAAPTPAPLADHDNRPILFLHIPKTAGTSLLTMLQNLFGENRTERLRYEDPDLGGRIRAALAGGPDAPVCLSGHLPVHIFQGKLDRFRPFTILRHPVARVFSLYRFLRRHPDLEKWGLTRSFTFQEFLACRAPNVVAQMHNGMCRMFCGESRFTYAEDDAFWEFDRQADAIGASLAALERMDVGLVEDMQGTQALLRAAWGVPFPLQEMTVNTTVQDGMEEAWRNIHRVIECNILDLTLYEKVSAQFHARMQRPVASLRPPSPAMVFEPVLDRATTIPNIPGRMGFYEFENVGFSWLMQGPPSRIYFRPPAGAARIALRIYGLTPEYPFEKLRLTVNGSPVQFQINGRTGGWCVLVSQPVALTLGEINELAIAPPYFVPVRFLQPGAVDNRALSVAISTVTFMRYSDTG